MRHASTQEPHRQSNNLAWLTAILLTAALHLTFTAGAQIAGFVADDAIYLLMADYFSGAYPNDPMLEYLSSVSHLPPFYSMVLAALGAGSVEMDVAHFVQTLIMLAGMIAWALFAQRLTHHHLTAVLVFMALTALPSTVLLSTEIRSEFLFLLLIGVAANLALSAARDPKYWVIAALVVGLAAITRGFGVIAVLALCGLVAMRARAQLLVVITLSFAPMLSVHWLELGGGIDYVDIFRSRVPSFAALVRTVGENLSAFVGATRGLLWRYPDGFSDALCVFLLVLSSSTWLSRLKALEFDAVYLLGYLALLFMWPFPEVIGRLAYPLTPLLVIYSALAFRACCAHLWPRFARHTAALLAALILVVALGQSVPLAARYMDKSLTPELANWRATRYWLAAPSVAGGLADLRHKQAMLSLLQETGQLVPASACIYALNPQAVMFYARRASWPAPTDATRPDQPGCRFHIVLSDRQMAASVTSLWPRYDIARRSEIAQGIAGLLVRYPP
jgi:hypothetical protein